MAENHELPEVSTTRAINVSSASPYQSWFWTLLSNVASYGAVWSTANVSQPELILAMNSTRWTFTLSDADAVTAITPLCRVPGAGDVIAAWGSVVSLAPSRHVSVKSVSRP